jgi:dihydroorotate dehydrogenase
VRADKVYRLARPLLFRLDAERAHDLTLRALGMAGSVGPARRLLRRLFDVRDPRLEVTVAGLRFRNPVGLAAGYDKNGVAVRGLAALGFGHLELGTVTPRPQAGNPKPRVHRLPEARAVVNSMGFPNAGIEALASRLAAWNVERESEEPIQAARTAAEAAGTVSTSGRVVATGAIPTRIGVNLGKGKDTPLERAAEDYCRLVRLAHSSARPDYLAINVSSPNTLGLRQLQGRAAMEELLVAVAETRDEIAPRLPVFVKIAPDLSESEIDDVLAAVARSRMDGVIATNTTTSREDVPAAAEMKGGLSGTPLRARALAVISFIARQTGGRLPIVGVGGIGSAADALAALRAGAHLVQVYTGLVYTGPGLVREINLGLLAACEAEGLAHAGALTAAGAVRRSP